ncbi:TrmB family transcriptional regulator [Tumebacillus sp. ITR2]|uniref:TrmB family transcriptional regulator n=1 Tax=Tumebacillus amylolyticus TaxID=2801339 RepID=A0ABS1J6R7_9BACL|nr:TrmB family transcriptional regulator [Tumebacillus amylolyticus]MBL0385967.1 TrmB family transcriptional regulator [Tumebacillus amylolyticus]
MLTRFGFTDYENKVYETLHHVGKPMTGYALAKDSGVPRGKIYEVLHRLVDKGIILESMTGNKSEYQAVDIEIVIKALTQNFYQNVEKLRDAYREDRPEIDDRVWMLKQDSSMLLTMEEWIKKATSSIRLSLWADEFETMRPLLEQKQADGIQVEALSLGSVSSALQHLTTFPVPQWEHHSLERWRLLIVDEARILLAIFHGGEMKGVMTSSPQFVQFFLDFFYHDVVLTEITNRYYDDVLVEDEHIRKLLIKLRY